MLVGDASRVKYVNVTVSPARKPPPVSATDVPEGPEEGVTAANGGADISISVWLPLPPK
jgi:hypothetical protein